MAVKIKHTCQVCRKEYLSYQKEDSVCSKECLNKGMVNKSVRACEYCGKEFTTTCKENESTKYCSLECYKLANPKKSDAKLSFITCPICGNIFVSFNHDKKYCSALCSRLAQQDRITCTCDYCGKQFTRMRSEAEKRSKHYCSIECRFNSQRWNEYDIEVLRNNYRKISTRDIQSMLSKDYSTKAIRSRAQALGLGKSRTWTPKEEQIVLDSYENKPLSEVMLMLPNRTIPSIMHKARDFNLMSNFYLNRVYTEDELQYLKTHYLDMTDEELAQALGRNANGISQKLHMLDLYRPQEIKKDGYKDVARFIRARLAGWKTEVKEAANYTCCLTGSRSNIVVHHCRGFNLLLEEAIDILNFPEYNSLEDYSDKELLSLFNTFYDLQEYYHEYVCVTEPIHVLFHGSHGYGDNTIEQWNEFCERYKSGYYDLVS